MKLLANEKSPMPVRPQSLTQLPVTAFIPTSDVNRARTFYEETLGFQVLGADQYAVVLKVANGTVRIIPVKDHRPAKFTVLGWQTSDMAATLDELTAKRIELLKLPFPGQDARGVMRFGTGDQVAWFCDPDGNILSVSQLA
jgi:catechol 2,3-dioxygenase-like lactoylglutathione lyase family enzyme